MKKLLFILILAPVLLRAQELDGKRIFHEIDQVQAWQDKQGQKTIDTIWIDYVIDTIPVVIAYIDTTTTVSFLDTCSHLEIALIDDLVHWMNGYVVKKVEVYKPRYYKDWQRAYGSFGKPVYLDSKKQTLAPGIRKIQLMFY